MQSISISNSKECILEIKNMTLSYSVPYYKKQTLRDFFIETLRSPYDFLTKEDDKILVLDNIDLVLQRSERLGILGNNACGKTSLCRSISGMYGKNQHIKIQGSVKSIYDTEVAVLPELSGRENLEILALLFFPEFSKKERRSIVEETIQFSELGRFIDVPYKLYSKGMRARICLSLISARPADLLILDEVFNGADHFFSEKMAERIKKLIFASGAVMFVSHSHDLIREVCNRAIVIDNKKIVFDGNTDEAILYYKKHCHRTAIQNG